VNRTVGLVAVWLLFATTAVGVGFAAAGVMEEPFRGGPRVVEAVGPTADPAPTSAVSGSRTPAATRSVDSPPPPTRTVTAPRVAPSAPRSTSRPTPSATRVTTRPAASTRGISTAGGYVSATCTGSLTRVSASPNPGWELKDISEPGRSEGEAEFERTGDGGDSTVEVAVRCVDGKPVFTVQSEAEAEDHDPDESSTSPDD
jgi:hypothetical protein